MHKLRFCTNCNLYRLFVQVATCTKSQYLHNMYVYFFVDQNQNAIWNINVILRIHLQIKAVTLIWVAQLWIFTTHPRLNQNYSSLYPTSPSLKFIVTSVGSGVLCLSSLAYFPSVSVGQNPAHKKCTENSACLSM